MGEAKRRGSAQDRQEQASKARAVEIEDAKNSLGLPASAVFAGYIVHVSETDDYLGEVAETAAGTRRGYVETPERAIRYTNKGRAAQAADSLPKSATVGLLFDVGSQWQVAFLGEPDS